MTFGELRCKRYRQNTCANAVVRFELSPFFAGTKSQVLPTAMRPHFPMELFLSRTESNGLSRSECILAWNRVRHVLQDVQNSFEIEQQLCRCNAVRRASHSH